MFVGSWSVVILLCTLHSNCAIKSSGDNAIKVFTFNFEGVESHEDVYSTIQVMSS